MGRVTRGSYFPRPGPRPPGVSVVLALNGGEQGGTRSLTPVGPGGERERTRSSRTYIGVGGELPTAEAREDKLRYLYDAQRARLLRYALNRVASAEDAAEVLAETFAIAWAHIDEVPAGEGALLWLYTTARGVLANLGRRERRRSALVDRMGEELRRQAGRLGDGPNEDSLLGLAILASMDEKDRELLMLAAWEGLGPAQLGVVLGCSPTAASIRLHRARARLKKKLATAGLIGAVAARKERTEKEVGAHVRNATATEP